MTTAFIVWSEKYEVHIASLDAQHKKIIELINALFKAKQKGEDPDIVQRTLEDLLAYAMSHFSHEEELLAEHRYPELHQQREEHRKFVEKVAELQEKAIANGDTSLLRLFDFLKEWWLHHIQGEDKKYSPFLTAKGLR